MSNTSSRLLKKRTSPSEVFKLACAFDDGHGLTAIEFSGAWYGLADKLGKEVNDALAKGSSKDAAIALAKHIRSVMVGIHNKLAAMR